MHVLARIDVYLVKGQWEVIKALFCVCVFTCNNVFYDVVYIVILCVVF